MMKMFIGKSSDLVDKLTDGIAKAAIVEIEDFLFDVS